MKCPKCKKSDSIYVGHDIRMTEGFRVHEYNKESKTIVVSGDPRWYEITEIFKEYLHCASCGHEWSLKKKLVEYE